MYKEFKIFREAANYARSLAMESGKATFLRRQSNGCFHVYDSKDARDFAMKMEGEEAQSDAMDVYNQEQAAEALAEQQNDEDYNYEHYIDPDNQHDTDWDDESMFEQGNTPWQ